MVSPDIGAKTSSSRLSKVENLSDAEVGSSSSAGWLSTSDLFGDDGFTGTGDGRTNVIDEGTVPIVHLRSASESLCAGLQSSGHSSTLRQIAEQTSAECEKRSSIQTAGNPELVFPKRGKFEWEDDDASDNTSDDGASHAVS